MFKDILLPIDLPNAATQARALECAVVQAKAYGARLHVMTVVPDFGSSLVGSFFPDDAEQKAIDEANKRLHAYVKASIPAGIEVQHIVAHGGVYNEILRVARDVGADLIVMASHRPELQDYLLGPNAASVVRHAACSVLVVR